MRSNESARFIDHAEWLAASEPLMAGDQAAVPPWFGCSRCEHCKTWSAGGDGEDRRCEIAKVGFPRIGERCSAFLDRTHPD